MTRIEFIPQVTPDGGHVILHAVPETPAQRLRELLRALAGAARGRRRRSARR